MNPWLALLAIVVLCSVVALAVGTGVFLGYRRPWRVRCPRDGVEAQVQVDALGAAIAEATGHGRPSVERCSHRWHVKDCDEACLATPASAHRPVRADDPPLPVVGTPAVLVPLDGTRGSEAALPTALTLARERGARVRLLRVMPVTGTVRDPDDRVVAYSDQESARDEGAARWYLRSLRDRFGDVPVEEVVRFGEPAVEILREAEEPDVALIAMATRPTCGLRRWLRRSVTRVVAREAWVPVARATFGAPGA